MGDYYIQAAIVLLSIDLVLALLIVYISRQTLTLKRQYNAKLDQQKNGKDELWIGPAESSNQIDTIAEKTKNGTHSKDEPNQKNQMITFNNQSMENLVPKQANNINNQHHLSSPELSTTVAGIGVNGTASASINYSHTYNANELSEYCVPVIEPTDHHQ